MTASFADMLSTTRKRTRVIFGDEYSYGDEERSHRTRIASKIRGEYENVKELPFFLADKRGKAKPSIPKTALQANGTIQTKLIEDVQRSQRYRGVPIQTNESHNADSTALTKRIPTSRPHGAGGPTQSTSSQLPSTSLVRRNDYQPIKPEWHAPWKLRKVLSGHFGWVRALAMEPGNQWFCSGSGDRTIKIWDLASGTLKLTLTGHISTVRGLAVSPRHPYLFSCGEDRMVKCWDLE